MGKKLIFLDVDETLYSKSQRGVPDSAVKAVHMAQKNGHKVFINTGRPLVYFEKEILEIGFDGLLCSNGVQIIIDGETIYHKELPLRAIEHIKANCEKYKIRGIFEGSLCSYFYDHDESYHPYYGFMISAFDQHPYMNREYSWEHANKADKGIVFADVQSDMPGFIRSMDEINDIMEYIRINDGQYELILKGHNKGTGLLAVAKHFGMSADDCYVFGDSNNDAPMFDVAGHSIAMGNSCEELKAIAEYVTDGVDDDGLYKAFKHYNLI